MNIKAVYNADTGWISVKFDRKPSREVLESLRKAGFRWRPRSKVWTAKWSFEREKVAENIAGKVEVIEREIDYERKAEYYRKKGEKLMRDAKEYLDKAYQLMKAIPPGQPILIGHHSERSHRSDLRKIDNWLKKGYELKKEAEKYLKKAEEYEKIASQGEDPVKIKSRIERLEAEERRLLRELELINIEKKLGKSLREFGIYTQDEERIKKMLERVRERLKSERKKYEKSGGIPAERMKLNVGDIVYIRGLGKAVIKKVNRKSVRVEFLNPALKTYNNFRVDKKEIVSKVESKMKYV